MLSEVDLLSKLLPFAGGTGLGLFGAVVIVLGYRKMVEESGTISLVNNLREEMDRLAKVNKELSLSVRELQKEILDLRTENIDLRSEIHQLRNQLTESPACATCPHRVALRTAP